MSITTIKSELKTLLKVEKQIYYDYMFQTPARRFMAWLKSEPVFKILQWQIASRNADFYHYKTQYSGNILDKILYIWYVRKRNIKAIQLGLEIETKNIKSGFLLYHYGATVINGGAIIGKNCHLHGNNCIGNAGAEHSECPVIGDNVMIGVGAKIIGDVRIANNIKIAAGAVVVSSFMEEGITIAGVPARKIK